MWMLAVTVCLAWHGEAECKRSVEHVRNAGICKMKGKAFQQYYSEADAPGQKVIFVGYTCRKGKDT